MLQCLRIVSFEACFAEKFSVSAVTSAWVLVGRSRVLEFRMIKRLLFKMLFFSSVWHSANVLPYEAKGN